MAQARDTATRRILAGLLTACCCLCCNLSCCSNRDQKRRQEMERKDAKGIRPRNHVPRSSDSPNTRRRRALSVPQQPESKSNRDEHEQSQSPLFSNLPAEIRQKILEECLGGMNFHIYCSDRKLRHDLCYSPAPATCDEDVGGRGCHRYEDKSKPRSKQNLISLPLTCRRIYSEAINILYGHNKFTTGDQYTMEYLPQLLLTQRVNAIKSLDFKWYLVDGRPARLLDTSNGQKSVWYTIWNTIWQNFANMKGLQCLRITMCGSGGDWAMLSETDAIKVFEPLRMIKRPRYFLFNLPFDASKSDLPWSELPCQIGRTNGLDSWW